MLCVICRDGGLRHLVPRSASSLGRRRGSELCEVGKAERLFDLGDLFDGILEAVLAELLTLNVFELVAHLTELPFREGILPSREDDRVFARRVVPIHQDEGLEGAGERLGIAAADRAPAGNRQDVVGDLAPAIVLRDQHVDVTGGGAAGLSQRRENMGFLELLLVIVLAKAAEQQRRAAERVRINVGSITALSDALSVVGGAGSGACGSGRWRRSGYGIDEVAFGVRFLKNGDRFT